LTLSEYMAVIRRRKWIILAFAAIGAVLALGYSLHQQKLYQASASVTLSGQQLPVSLGGQSQNPVEAARYASTQASLAATPTVAGDAIARAGVHGLSATRLLSRTSVTPSATADVLTFAVDDPSAARAKLLATAFAQAFVAFRQSSDHRAVGGLEDALKKQIASVKRQIGPNPAGGAQAKYAVLLGKLQDLRSFDSLNAQSTFVSSRAGSAAQTQPKIARNLLAGIGIGLILGLIAAFVREALDTRVRSTGEVAAQLSLPVLARIGAPPRELRARNALALIEQPGSPHAEAFRILRARLEFANARENARIVMVTSAVEQEGKSTTVANLAVALAQAGKRVVLVDLDLRRPFIDRFFPEASGIPGISDVVLGRARLEDAVALCDVVRDDGTAAPVAAKLQVVPAGAAPSNPAELMETAALARALEELAEQADIVLIDAPPLLPVSDALTLSSRVDALLVVTRAEVLRHPMLQELQESLDAMPARKLGFVLTGAGDDRGYGYGYYGAPRASRLPSLAIDQLERSDARGF